MNGAITLSIAAILAWAVHIVLYVRYAVAFHPHRRAWRFIGGHCAEMSFVFGFFFVIGILLAENLMLSQLLQAAGVVLLLDILTYALARDFFRPLMSPINAFLPPVCAIITVLLLFFFFGRLN